MLKSLLLLCTLTVIYSCTKAPGVVPTVNTGEITDITATNAIASGEVIGIGDGELLAIGLVVSERPNPTINSEVVTTVKDLALGEFISELTNLRTNSTYYIRAYATNAAGTAYGDEITFQTFQSIPLSLEFEELTEIKGYNFTQAIGFQGLDGLQSLYLANRQVDTSVGIQYEHLYKYDIINGGSMSVFNPVIDFISKEIQIIDNQIIVIGSQFISTYEFDLEGVPIVVANNKNLSRHGSAQYNSEVYVYGGDLNRIDSDKIMKWDPQSNSFITIATMPTPKAYAGGEIVNGKLYIFGGQQEFSGTPADNIIYVYSISDNTFESFNLPVPLYRSYTAVVGDYIYVGGHRDLTGFDNSDIFFGVFNTLDNKFTQIPINLTDEGITSIWGLTVIGNDLYVVYGDPNNVDPVSGEQTFTIQKASIP